MGSKFPLQFILPVVDISRGFCLSGFRDHDLGYCAWFPAIAFSVMLVLPYFVSTLLTIFHLFFTFCTFLCFSFPFIAFSTHDFVVYYVFFSFKAIEDWFKLVTAHHSFGYPFNGNLLVFLPVIYLPRAHFCRSIYTLST